MEATRSWFATMAVRMELAMCCDVCNARFPICVSLVERNTGYGSALNLAVASCQGAFIATIDSDGQFLVDDVLAMLRPLQGGTCDAVLGYRIRKNDTWLRRLADRALNGIVRLIFQVRVHDCNCALKVINRHVLQALTIEASGFAFPTEVCLKVIHHGAPLRGVSRVPSGARKWRQQASRLAGRLANL